MSPEDIRLLNSLLHSFDVTRLGEGNTAAGANLLASMACSLASVQRPGSGLINRNDDTITAGTSLLVSGAHSCSLISEKILNGLAMRQNNLTARLHQRNRNRVLQPCGAGPVKVGPGGFTADTEEMLVEQLLQPGNIMDEDAPALWGVLLNTPLRMDPGDLDARPLIYLTGSKTSDLSSRMQRCHLGRPLVHLGVDSVADFTRYEHLCPALMDGRTTLDNMVETIRGSVIVTDPGGVLGEVVRTDISSARWASRLLWLIDDNTGPDPCNADDDSPVPLDGITRRYARALGVALGQRINTRNTGPAMLENEFTDIQATWVEFLRKMEPEFPGIVGVGRNLYATLWFGLNKMIDVSSPPAGFQLVTGHVLALAKILVHRMVNVRMEMLELAKTDLRLNLAASIIHRLADGPHGIRQLSRRFDRLSSGDCHGLLLDLQASGRVSYSRGKWRLAQSTPATDTDARHLILDA